MIARTLLFLCLGASAWAQSHWKVVGSTVGFRIQHVAGAIAEGTFGGLKATIQFDPLRLDQTLIQGSVEANTFHTGNSIRDKTLRGEEYFDAGHYPLLQLSCTKVVAKGGNEYEGVFRVTIKSTTKEAVWPFRFVAKEKQGFFHLQFRLNRLDFGIGSKSWLLANEAAVDIQIATEKIP